MERDLAKAEVGGVKEPPLLALRIEREDSADGIRFERIDKFGSRWLRSHAGDSNGNFGGIAIGVTPRVSLEPGASALALPGMAALDRDGSFADRAGVFALD